jgi:tRNA pseudouridine38-40 synthase
MSRLRCVVAYDGTDFAGWQKQGPRRTVQGALESAIHRVTGEVVMVVGAGRTDAGVHASGQAVHFDTEWNRPCPGLERALNAVLPRDVAVADLKPAPPGFHARYSALGRWYRYTVWNAPVRAPLLRRTSLHVPMALDVSAMRQAGEMLLGEHDFGAFGRPVGPSGGTVRRLDRCDVERDGGAVRLDFEANAFLRHQVRRMVGLLLEVGLGRVPARAAADVVLGAPGAIVPRRVAPQGLVLLAVSYPPDDRMTESPRRATEQGSDG